jgi:hypothetical protein
MSSTKFTFNNYNLLKIIPGVKISSLSRDDFFINNLIVKNDIYMKVE